MKSFLVFLCMFPTLLALALMAVAIFWRRPDPALARLGNEVRWLQKKFDCLLEMEEQSLRSDREVLCSLEELRGRVERLEELADVIILPEEGPNE